MTVVLDRPYRFVPPHRGDRWPSFIQRFRIVDQYLKRKEGVVSYELRDMHHWQSALDRGDGILLAPNHCRYADPLVMGWPARELGVHLYAMASWHLFNKGSIDAFAIQKMGAFSIYREGSDRQSLETAIDTLTTAERPLILFPEGTTNRTNDVLKPLLDGVSFIARTAARRRKKGCGGQIVMLPVGLKYLCKGDVNEWADRQLLKIESQFGWRSPPPGVTVLNRTVRMAEAVLALKEIEHLGRSSSGQLPQRRDHLMHFLLDQTETQLGMKTSASEPYTRVRGIRAEIATQFFASESESQRRCLRDQIAKAELVQELTSYNDCYLQSDQATDTRVVETIQRMQELLYGKADTSMPLHVIVQCDEAITVPTQRAPKNEPDPLMTQLEQSLSGMLAELSKEARPMSVVVQTDN